MYKPSLVEQLTGVRIPTPKSLIESFWRDGQAIDIFVPLYYTANLKENDGMMTTLEYISAIDEKTGSTLKQDVAQHWAGMQEDEGEDEEGDEDPSSRGDGRVDRHDWRYEGEDMTDEQWDDAFNSYVNENGGWHRWLEGWREKKSPAADFEDESVIEGVLEAAQDDWNESNMAQYAEDVPGLKSIQCVDYGRVDKKEKGAIGILLRAEFDTTPDDATTKALVGWVSGQMSDGWGEGFEQNEFGSRRGGMGIVPDDEIYEYSFHFWASDYDSSYTAKSTFGTGENGVRNDYSVPRMRDRKTIPSGVKQLPGKMAQGARDIGRKLGGRFMNSAPVTHTARVAKEIQRRATNMGKAMRGESESKASKLVSKLVEE